MPGPVTALVTDVTCGAVVVFVNPTIKVFSAALTSVPAASAFIWSVQRPPSAVG